MGPLLYTGRDMKTSHRGCASAGDWAALMHPSARPWITFEVPAAAFFSLRLYSAHRFFVAVMIRFRPAALIRRFFGAGAGFRHASAFFISAQRFRCAAAIRLRAGRTPSSAFSELLPQSPPQQIFALAGRDQPSCAAAIRPSSLQAQTASLLTQLMQLRSPPLEKELNLRGFRHRSSSGRSLSSVVHPCD